jgi:hypothetical protein
LPEPIAEIALHNKAVVYGILFTAAAETLRVMYRSELAMAAMGQPEKSRRRPSATGLPSVAEPPADGEHCRSVPERDSFAHIDSNLEDVDAFTGRTGRRGGDAPVEELQGYQRCAGAGAISGVPRRYRDGP